MPGRAESGQPHAGARLRVLDVRPALARDEHPKDEVLAAAAALVDGGVLEVVAPFEPRPLMARLREAGCAVEAARQADGTWVVRAGKGALPPLDALTDLEPPEPLERVLAALAALPAGAAYTAHLPRSPVLLYPQLDARGFEWEVARRPDGTAVLWARRLR